MTMLAESPILMVLYLVSNTFYSPTLCETDIFLNQGTLSEVSSTLCIWYQHVGPDFLFDSE